jgi:DNA-directed RNA polymerase specialized sigma24 family protein
MRLLGHASLAEDCVAETFARFLKALQKRQGPRDHLQAYLYRIAHNWIVDLYCDYAETIELSEAMHCEKVLEEEAAQHIQQQPMNCRATRKLLWSVARAIAVHRDAISCSRQASHK